MATIGISSEEKYWERYLSYFLSPHQPHGFGTAVLNAILDVIAANKNEFSPEIDSLGSVNVTFQVGTDQGIPDILLWVDGRWFYCIELKVHAAEGKDQTNRYATADRLEDIDVEQFEPPTRNYVYISPRFAPDSESDSFLDISWQEIVEAVTPIYKQENCYPQQSVIQLTEFCETIKQELAMSDTTNIESELQRLGLFFEYQEEIELVERSIKKVRKHLQTQWPQELQNAAGWNSEWQIETGKGFYHTSWRPTIEHWSNEPIQLHLQPGVHAKNPDDLEQGRLTLRLVWPGTLKIRQNFNEIFHSERWADELDPVLEANNIEKGDQDDNFRFTYTTFPFERSDLPESYYDALRTSFDQHVALVPIITEMVKDTIESDYH